jgi:hypothetical protein
MIENSSIPVTRYTNVTTSSLRARLFSVQRMVVVTRHRPSSSSSPSCSTVRSQLKLEWGESNVPAARRVLDIFLALQRLLRLQLPQQLPRRVKIHASRGMARQRDTAATSATSPVPIIIKARMTSISVSPARLLDVEPAT